MTHKEVLGGQQATRGELEDILAGAAPLRTLPRQMIEEEAAKVFEGRDVFVPLSPVEIVQASEQRFAAVRAAGGTATAQEIFDGMLGLEALREANFFARTGLDARLPQNRALPRRVQREIAAERAARQPRAPQAVPGLGGIVAPLVGGI